MPARSVRATRRRPDPRPHVGESIHRYPVSLTSLECHASELVNSDACPYPTPRQAAGGSSFYAAMDTNRNTTADVNPGPGVVRYRYRQARGRRAVLLHGGLLPFIACTVFKRAGWGGMRACEDVPRPPTGRLRVRSHCRFALLLTLFTPD